MSDEGEMLALFKILRVVLVGIGFPLEGYVAVSLDISAELDYPENPFYQIDYVEKQITEFLDLRRVDHLVVNHYPVTRPLGKQYPEKIYRIKPFPERDYLVIDYFHCLFYKMRQAGRTCRSLLVVMIRILSDCYPHLEVPQEVQIRHPS